MSYFSEPEKKPFSLKIGLFVMALIAIGATYASNISINGSNRIEFGQGVYAIEACNGWVQIQVPGSETYNGNSYIEGLLIDGVDPDQCGNTHLRIRAYSSNSGLLGLYLYGPGKVAQVEMTDVWLYIDEFGHISLTDESGTTLVDSTGTSVGANAGVEEFITMSRNSSTGRLTVGFVDPVSTWGELNSFTIETSN